MTDTKFTKGPWAYLDLGEVVSEENFEVVIAHINSAYSSNIDAGDANGQLIAASPDLYAALEGLLERYTGLVNCGDCGHWNPETEAEVIEARAALKKARGE